MCQTLFPQDMIQLKVEMQEALLAKEDQEEVLRRRERELTALKGALKEEVAAHDQEVDKMREQYEKEISKLQVSFEEAKQVIGPPLCLCSPYFLRSHPQFRNTPVREECVDKYHIRGAVRVYVLHCKLYHMLVVICANLRQDYFTTFTAMAQTIKIDTVF